MASSTYPPAATVWYHLGFLNIEVGIVFPLA